MKYLLALLISVNCLADPIKVAIVDTGLNLNDFRLKSHLCKEGHKDFTGEGIIDSHGHGTFMAGKIEEYAKDADYCMIILKYYKVSDEDGEGKVMTPNASRTVEALKEAIRLKVDFVNYSGGGARFYKDEYDVMMAAKDVTFVVAAGNDGQELDLKKVCYFPACYQLPNILVVGNITATGERSSSSNYGSMVKFWEVGNEVWGYAVKEGSVMYSGTSVSTAIHTGKRVYERHRK